MAVQKIADDLLWISAPVWVWLTIVYVLLERSRGWIRMGLVLTVIGITQMILRALATATWGEGYWGRDWVLLTGRLEIIVAGVILAIGLHRARWGTTKTRKAMRDAARAHLQAHGLLDGTVTHHNHDGPADRL